jgi:hypothetical protein
MLHKRNMAGEGKDSSIQWGLVFSALAQVVVRIPLASMAPSSIGGRWSIRQK